MLWKEEIEPIEPLGGCDMPLQGVGVKNACVARAA